MGHRRVLKTPRKLWRKAVERAVRRLETDGQVERFLRVALLEELPDLVRDDPRFQMDRILEQRMRARSLGALGLPNLRRTVAMVILSLGGAVIQHIIAGALVPVTRLTRSPAQ